MTTPIDGLADTVTRAMPPARLTGRTRLSGPIPTVWSSDGIGAAWSIAQDAVLAARPPAVQLHTWDPRGVADRVRVLLPSAALLVGAGIDGVARHVALGDWSVTQGVRVLTEIARRARDQGAVVIVWNAEAAWKRPPSTPERARLEQLITEALRAVSSTCPDLDQWHTAYDHPSLHGTYPWRAWLGEGSPISVSLPQVYAAPEGGLSAHRGALPRREAAALSSWAAAVRAGRIRPDAPDGTPGDLSDVDWRPYYQLHHVAAVDTVASALSHPLACLWALPTRADTAGREALAVLCAVHRTGLWGDVRALQRTLGVADDGVYGPATHAAAVVWAGRA